MIQRLWHGSRRMFIRRVLGLQDTPHRIAWGVFLGMLIAMTPTLGFQILLYVALATALNANKVSGIPFLFISNPLTAVPLYVFNWRVGVFLTRLGTPDHGERAAIEERLAETDPGASFWSRMFSMDFWIDLGNSLLEMGLEMWLGSLIVGLLTGIPAYFIVRAAVRKYRQRRIQLLAKMRAARRRHRDEKRV